MINTNKIRFFSYINYIILSCIVPIGYFAPLGEWLLISFLAISVAIIFLSNSYKVTLKNFHIPIIAIVFIIISYFYSINLSRSLESMIPVIGMIISIYIVLNLPNIYKIKNLDTIIGIPTLITSSCVFLDIVFSTEIRSSLALLAGDEPTSASGNFSRGIIILTMMMPISVALFINNKKYVFAFFTLILITLVVILGPNESSKVALICTYFTALIVYFLGAKSFFYFGAISLLWIIFCPFLAIKVIPIIKNVNYEIDTIYTCEEIIRSANVHKFPYRYTDDSEIVIKNQNVYQTYKVLKNGNCPRIQPWQDTSVGGSIIHRLLVWEYVGKNILKKPFTGYGIGTSRLIGQNIIHNIPNTNIEIKGGIPLHPHNNLIQIWLELGLLGALIMSLIWIKIIKFGINVRKSSYIIGTGVCTSIVTTFVICNLTFGVFQAWWMASIGLFFLVIMQASEKKNNNRKVI